MPWWSPATLILLRKGFLFRKKSWINLWAVCLSINPSELTGIEHAFLCNTNFFHCGVWHFQNMTLYLHHFHSIAWLKLRQMRKKMPTTAAHAAFMNIDNKHFWIWLWKRIVRMEYINCRVLYNANEIMT